MNRRRFLTTLALTTLILGACAAPPPRLAVTASAPVATPQDTTALFGVYTTVISKEDLSSNKTVSEAEVCENAGVFTYTLSAGHWNLKQTAAPGCTPMLGTSFDGEWTLSGDQMSFHQDIASGCSTDYVFTWKLDGTNLIHTAVKDDCPPRVVVFTTHPWVRQTSSAASPALTEIPIADAASTTLKVNGFPDWLEVGFGSLWVSSPGIGAIQRIDLKTNQVVSKIPVPSPCAAMTIGFDAVWVANCSTSEIFRIDARTNEIVAKIKAPLATSESSISAGEGGVWLVSDSRGILTRIDPATNTVIAEIKVKRESSAAMAGYGGVWVTNTGGYSSKEGTVQRVDPLTNSIVATITVGGHPRFLAVGEGGVWVLNQTEGTVSHIDPKTNQVVATIDTGVIGEGGDIAAGEGAVWVRGASVLLVVIDPATNQVIKRYGPSQGSGAVRAREGRVWISAHDVSQIWGLNTSP